MSSPPSSPHRPALINRTNVADDDCPRVLSSGFSPPGNGRKRTCGHACVEPPKKRPRLGYELERSPRNCSGSDSDSEADDALGVARRSRAGTVHGLRDRYMSASGGVQSRAATLPTQSILRSFVSSHKSDAYKCLSVNEDQYMTLPYACAYSHDAKRGGAPLLAVATEQGTVHILDTSKRPEWEYDVLERTTLQPHTNGIFDMQWSPSDNLIATASGDTSTRITTLDSSVPTHERTLHVLRGHGGTIKSLAWDPCKDGSVLCTGGRDGAICVWDLRVGEGRGDAEETGDVAPVITIPNAHESGDRTKVRVRKGKLAAAAPLRSITSLLYLESNPFCLISSGSFDGILRQWDLRQPSETPKGRKKKTPSVLKPIHVSSIDPTTYTGARRGRGITALTAGCGPSRGLLFGVGTDARVHTYALPSLEPLSGHGTQDEDLWAHAHPKLQTNSFYVRAAVSPCGRWLASGGASNGSAFLFDIGTTASAGRRMLGGYASRPSGVQLCGHKGEVGALDWAQDTLATCGDDGIVRLWRPDVEVQRRCAEDPETMGFQWSWAMAS